MRVLIIGGTRFIGRHITRALVDKGYDVTLFHRGKFEPEDLAGIPHIHGDRSQLASFRSTFKSEKFDVLIDMIALFPGDALQVKNAVGGLIQKCLVLSSADVYLAWQGVLENVKLWDGMLSENATLRTRRFIYKDAGGMFENYEKIEVENEYLAISNQGDIPTCIIRLPMVYGPFDPQKRTAPFDEWALSEHHTVNISQSKSWLVQFGYVENIAEAVFRVIQAGHPGQVYNAGDEQVISQLDWLKMIGSYFSVDWHLKPCEDESLVFENLRSLKQDIVLDTSKIRSHCQYKDRFTIEEGLARTLEYRKYEIAHQ